MILDLGEMHYQGVQYEYVVLVTSLLDGVRTVAQHYRGRGDAENNFDELKNQWGWAGFATKDRKRCQIMGRIIAAITSRPLALHGIARQTRHGNQTTIEITSMHSKAPQISEILTGVSGFLKRIQATAEQLSQGQRWKLILSAAFRSFLGGKILGSPGRLADATGLTTVFRFVRSQSTLGVNRALRKNSTNCPIGRELSIWPLLGGFELEIFVCERVVRKGGPPDCAVAGSWRRSGKPCVEALLRT